MSKRIIILLSFLILIPWIGVKDFYSRGEAREALVAQSMMLQNNYLLPSSYSGAVPSKPPLLHWLINGTSFFTQEIDEATSRFPSAILSIIFIFVFLNFLERRITDPWIAPLALLTSFQWYRNSTTTRVDLLLSVSIGIALFELYKWYERKTKVYPTLAVISLTAATLTKGPVGLVLPLMIFFIFVSWEEYLKKNLNFKSIYNLTVKILILALPIIILSSLWYIACYRQEGDRFFQKFWYENAQRLAGTMADSPHKHSVFYLYGTGFLSLLPWSLVWILPIYNWIKKFKFSFPKFERPIERFFFVWILVFVVVFSIPSSKRDVYLLPALAPLSFYLIPRLREISDKTKVLISNLVLTLCGALLSLSIAVTFIDKVPAAIVQLHFAFSDYWINYKWHYLLVFLICFSVIVVKKYVIEESPEHKKLISLFFSTIVLLIIVEGLLSPAITNQMSYKSPSIETYELTRNEKKLFSFNDAFYGISFYLKKPFFEVDENNSFPVENGKWYMFEDNKDKFKLLLTSNQCTKELYRSKKPVVVPNRFVSLIEVKNCFDK